MGGSGARFGAIGHGPENGKVGMKISAIYSSDLPIYFQCRPTFNLRAHLLTAVPGPSTRTILNMALTHCAGKIDVGGFDAQRRREEHSGVYQAKDPASAQVSILFQYFFYSIFYVKHQFKTGARS